MIIEFFFDIIFGFLEFLIGCFPEFPDFSILNVALSPLFYVLKLINNFVSVPLLGRCGLIILFVYNIKFAWSIVMWLIRKIPGVS